MHGKRLAFAGRGASRLKVLDSGVSLMAFNVPYVPLLEGNRVTQRIAAGLVLAMAWFCPAFAQNSHYEGQIVRKIRYDPAAQPLAQADLDRVQQLHTGDALHRSEVAAAIDAMFATGRYTDIQVDASETPARDGVVVTFHTQRAGFVGHVGVEGKITAPPDLATIVNTTNLDLGTPFRPEALDGIQKDLEQLFRANGLYGANVHLETHEDPATQGVDLTIVVKPGKRARYEEPVIEGDTKLSESAIFKATGWRWPIIHRWREVSAQLTQKGVDGVERKLESQDRLSETTTLKSLDYDSETRRVQPTLQIDAGPKIEVKTTEAKVSKRLLKRYVPIYLEGSVDRDLEVEGARNLRDHFQSKGYSDVDVSFRELPAENDERTIEYAIARGPKLRLTHLEIQGATKFPQDELRDRMFLRASSFRYRGGRYSEGFLKRDEENIASYYRDHGYRDVTVKSTSERGYKGKSGDLALTIHIAEGALWTVENLDIAGLDSAIQDHVQAELKSTAGKPYSDLRVAQDRAAILNACHDQGFLHAVFNYGAAPAGEHRVNLHYVVTMGHQEFVRAVVVTGLRHAKPKLATQDIQLNAGDPISLPKIRDSQHDLYGRGIFANVNTAIQNHDGDERQKNVLFDFTESHRYSLTVGVGAEIARLGATAANINAPQQNTGFTPLVEANLSRLDCFGLAQTATVSTRLSTLEQRGSLTYEIPRAFEVTNGILTISTLYDVNRDVLTFASRREEASLQWQQKFSSKSRLQGRFAFRRVSTTDVVIPSLLVPQLLQPVRIGIVSGTYFQDHRDNPSDPHSGFYNTVDAGIANGIFGSQRNFGRILGRNSTYHRLSKNLILARQTTIGLIKPFHTPTNFTESEAIPLPERFFGGGSLSDRAFPENQAGPRDIGTPAGPGATATDPTGFPLGGNAEFFNNVELRFPLIGDNIGGVLFWDAGNVYDTISDISFRFHQRNPRDFDYMVHSVGFGLRYRTPVGPIRADFAYSINPPRYVGFSGTLQQLLACNPNLPSSALPSVCMPSMQGVSHFQFFFSIGQTF